ncbi:MAG: AAA family ATPase [Proteobacteria bacterium]|nr:AAA family ATPase [Pseudomonadota bacterium]
MIRHFYIDNFKSLVDFSLPPKPQHLGKFTCLIGMNGTGKSTVLQAFDFIKQLTHGRMDDWLKARDWNISEIVSKLQRKRLITFFLEFEFPEFEIITWEGHFNPSRLRCTAESVKLGERDILKFADGVVTYSTPNLEDKLQAQDLNFQGSVISALLLDKAHPAIRSMREFMRDLKSLDMLAPDLMRKRSRDAVDVGYGGERLSAFLSGFAPKTSDRLLEVLQQFYPQVSLVGVFSIQGGWKDLMMVENYSDSSINARHFNDGMLRILSIVSQIEAKDISKIAKSEASKKMLDIAKRAGLGIHHEYRSLLFDEIENGIHPELIEKLMAYLLDAEQQIIVTTHSPMILNYLPDDVAKEAVILLYRTEEGITRSVRYFDLPSTQKKLKLLGPGEVFVDTDLPCLTLEAESLRGA